MSGYQLFETGRFEAWAGRDDVVPVGPGTAVRVDPGVWRTWRASITSAEPLRWICIRGGNGPLAPTGDEPARDFDRPQPEA